MKVRTHLCNFSNLVYLSLSFTTDQDCGDSQDLPSDSTASTASDNSASQRDGNIPLTADNISDLPSDSSTPIASNKGEIQANLLHYH